MLVIAACINTFRLLKTVLKQFEIISVINSMPKQSGIVQMLNYFEWRRYSSEGAIWTFTFWIDRSQAHHPYYEVPNLSVRDGTTRTLTFEYFKWRPKFEKRTWASEVVFMRCNWDTLMTKCAILRHSSVWWLTRWR